ncbi:hypothetical protein V8E55_012009 [Tylopilus felleus]
MQPYLTRAEWRTHIHIEGHLTESNSWQTTTCPHPRCTEAFESSKELDYSQDVHCWIPRASPGPRGELNRAYPQRPRERKRWTGRRKVPCGSYLFVDETNKFGESYFTPTSMIQHRTSSAATTYNYSATVARK